MINRDDIDRAVQQVRNIVAADGGDVEVTGVEAGTARLRLVLDTAECRECVMPRAVLEQVALDLMRPELPDLTAVQIDDPREPRL